MYADTLEFTPHLLTSVLPRDNDDPVSSSDTETHTIHVCDLRLSRLSFFLFFGNISFHRTQIQLDQIMYLTWIHMRIFPLHNFKKISADFRN